MKPLIVLLSFILAGIQTAHAEVPEGETLPQDRTLFVRALLGGALNTRFNPEFESVFGFGYGGEVGLSLFKIHGVGEFNAIGLAGHFDRFSQPGGFTPTKTSTFAGQILFFRNTDWGAYFGPEVGMRQVEDEFGNTASSLIAGVVGGVAVPLTTHLSYGPQISILGAAPVSVTLPNGTDGIETAVIVKIFLAVTAHL